MRELEPTTREIREQVEYYNAEWSNEDRQHPNAWQLLRATAILSAIAEFDKRRPSICELGAGTGWLTAMLGAVGNAVGIELSDVAVKRASQRFAHVRFECTDILRWDHPHQAYDIVVSHEVIEHVKDQRRYVEIAHELLRPGGRLILTTPNARAVAAMDPADRSHQPNEYLLTRKQLDALLRDRFSSVRVHSLILGGARRGLHRVTNARGLHAALKRVGLFRTFETLALHANLGLHLIAVANKR